jgi:hypothetical protein
MYRQIKAIAQHVSIKVDPVAQFSGAISISCPVERRPDRGGRPDEIPQELINCDQFR